MTARSPLRPASTARQLAERFPANTSSKYCSLAWVGRYVEIYQLLHGRSAV